MGFDYRWFVGLVVIVVIAIAVSSFLSQKNDIEQMKACVASGGEWKRDFGSYYECVR